MPIFRAKVIAVVDRKEAGAVAEVEIVQGSIHAGDLVIWEGHGPIKVAGLQIIWKGEDIERTSESSTGLLLTGLRAADLAEGTFITKVDK